MKVFEKIQSFISSLGEYIKNFSNLFLIFVGAFALLTVVIIFITSFAYECKLTKTVDKINKFLERNPKINDDNLVTFNNMLKARSVPKALRRQWQQFMLYREYPASHYMSFKHCVENPLRNSTYQQQMTVYKVISYVLVVLSFIVSIFMAQQSQFSNIVWQEIIIIPLVILVSYWLISMILNLIHNAISGDLFQNYQYFEINMDKAMLTLPEFVDYEVLFSQDEIRRGIPVLFAYLQKRAIQEQQELEKARLKSVDHEKFDFEKAGLDGSLVLERAMRETENFAAQRKKYLQEIERVNNEINVLENNYKEQTKEFQRQVQTSKETVENLKEQLEQATSTIEINYIKKQMRDELNRQQISEKEFDILTDKHNQAIKTLNQEVKNYYDEIKSAKSALEVAMLSEFNTYSIKVYDNLEKIVDEKMQDKVDLYKDQIRDLETELEEKNDELENVYVRYQEVLSQSPIDGQYQEGNEEANSKKSKKKKNSNAEVVATAQPELDQDPNDQYDYSVLDSADQQYYDNADYQQYDQSGDIQYNDYADDQAGVYQEDQYNTYQDGQYADYQQDGQYGDYQDEQYDEQNSAMVDYSQEYDQQNVDNSYDYDNGYIPMDENQDYVNMDYNDQYDYVPLADEGNVENDNYGEYIPLDQEYQNNDLPVNDNHDQDILKNEVDDKDFDIDFSQPEEDNFDDKFDFGFVDNKANVGNEPEEDEDIDFNDLFGFYDDKKDEKPEPKQVQKDHVVEEVENNIEDEESLEEDEEELDKPVERRKAGRPRKVVDQNEIKPKRSVGRPRKNVKDVDEKPKRRVGRPKKVTIEHEDVEVVVETKRGPGRPRKEETEEVVEPKRKVGRPRKDVEEVLEAPKRKAGRPKKIVVKVEVESKRKVGRPRKSESSKTVEAPKRKVGRPKKS